MKISVFQVGLTKGYFAIVEVCGVLVFGVGFLLITKLIEQRVSNIIILDSTRISITV